MRRTPQAFLRRLSKTAVCIAASVVLTAVSCATPPRYGDSVVTAEGDIAAPGTSFYLVKGNRSSYINNLLFDEYAGSIGSVLSDHSLVPGAYGNVEVIVMVRYGPAETTKTLLEFRREYDIRDNVTRWVQKKPVPEEVHRLVLTGLDAASYRASGTEEPLWEISVTRPVNGESFREEYPELLVSLDLHLASAIPR